MGGCGWGGGELCKDRGGGGVPIWWGVDRVARDVDGVYG